MSIQSNYAKLTDFLKFNIGNNRYPVPFKCVIKPRTPAAEALIRDSVNLNEEGLTGWEHSGCRDELNVHKLREPLFRTVKWILHYHIIWKKFWEMVPSIYRWIISMMCCFKTSRVSTNNLNWSPSQSHRHRRQVYSNSCRAVPWLSVCGSAVPSESRLYNSQKSTC